MFIFIYLMFSELINSLNKYAILKSYELIHSNLYSNHYPYENKDIQIYNLIYLTIT
jgi:hypothetical protein